MGFVFAQSAIAQFGEKCAVPSRLFLSGRIPSSPCHTRLEPNITLIPRAFLRSPLCANKCAVWGQLRKARSDVFDYIEMFYNPIRRHGSNDGLSPVEFERQFIFQQQSV
ncbi:IS3 family transposase [Aeromonas sp.]|uniref:IS3 family transposase n=1 Tax=Aeromonas sp. TaxID=647 RepID=UPI0025880760|nr:IS3 family transposase [Aeromonas sp.]MCX7132666.1 IS3 family transposase [Aeromonas sp.]